MGTRYKAKTPGAARATKWPVVNVLKDTRHLGFRAMSFMLVFHSPLPTLHSIDGEVEAEVMRRHICRHRSIAGVLLDAPHALLFCCLPRAALFYSPIWSRE